VTIPGEGYRFIGTVVEVEREAPPPPPEPAGRASGVHRKIETAELPALAQALPEPPVAPAEPPPAAAAPVPAPPPPRRRRAWKMAGAAAVLVLLVAGAVWLRASARPREPATAETSHGRTARPVVAVLGFKNRSGADKVQWLAPALSEILTTELSAGANLRVVSGENVARARQTLGLPYSESGEGTDLERLRTLLGADLAVVGSYAFVGSGAEQRIRLELRVLKLPEGVAVASLVETGTEPQLFDLVTAAGKDLRRSLGLNSLSPEEARQAQALHPANPEAARLYAQGLARLRTYDITGARDLLSQAAQADPGSALIHSALAQAWAQLGHDPRALEEARKALDLAALLSREQRLELDARLQEAGRKWGKASEIYLSLWTFFPDDLEYGLRLVNALGQAGRGKDALETIAVLRKLPPPACDDPRIDIGEAEVARILGDNSALERAASAAVAKGRRSGEALIVGRGLLLEGSVPLFTGHPLDSLPPFREAHDLYEKVGYRWGVAMADAHIGIAYFRNSDFAAAEKPYKEALEIAQQIGNATGIGNGLFNLGLLHQNRGDLTQALFYYDRCRAQYVAMDEPALGVWLLQATAGIHLAQGNVATARQESEEVLGASRKTGDRSHEAQALGTLGTILALRGSLAEARQLLDQALAVLRGGRDPEPVVPLLVESVDVLARLGDTAGARSQAEQGLTAARKAGYRLGVANLLGAFSRLSLRTGDLASARAQADEQLRLGREIGSRALVAWGLQNQGRALLTAGDLRGARAALEESLRESESAGDALRGTATRLDLADLALAEKNPAEASRIASAAAAWYEPRDVRREEARALSVLSEALLQEGHPAEARQVAARLKAQDGVGGVEKGWTRSARDPAGDS
jgi:tetratricopeptide (TPR) repeat protein